MTTTGIWYGCRVLQAVLGAALVLAGCVIIPVNYYPSGSRHNLTEDTERSLHPGIMTREEVLLLLGEPDYIWEDGQRLGYAWGKVRAIVAVALGYGQGAAGTVERTYLLQVWFDADGHVFQVTSVKDSGGQMWTTGGRPSGFVLLPLPTVTVTMAGTGTGAVTSSPLGISCIPACSASYASNTAVTLTPTPAAGSVFAGWSGACSGPEPCTVTALASRPEAVTATFNRE
jgi:hypothetical protein